MRILFFLSLYLPQVAADPGYGDRFSATVNEDISVDASSERQYVREDTSQLKVLAGLLLAMEPRAAFKLSGLAAPAHALGHRTGHPHMAAAITPDIDGSVPHLPNLEDSRLWLEGVESEEALQWVRKQNNNTLDAVVFNEPLYQRFVSNLNVKDNIPYVGRVLNGLVYNFWRDQDNPRGLWRRCTLDEYRKQRPDWENVLDIDALSAAENKSFVWAGTKVLDEGADVRTDRVLIMLSNKGSDAKVVREFDLDKKDFVSDEEHGFSAPEANWNICWKDRNTLVVSGEYFVDRERQKSAGFWLDRDPSKRERYRPGVYEWERGTPLLTSTKIYEGEESDYSVAGFSYRDRGEWYEIALTCMTYYSWKHELRQPNGSWAHIPFPDHVKVETFANQFLVILRKKAWLGYEAGTVLSFPVQDFMRTESDEARKSIATVLFSPTQTCSFKTLTKTRNYLIITGLNNVVTELRFWKFDKNAWSFVCAYKEDDLLSLSVMDIDEAHSDAFVLVSRGFTQPVTLSLADASAPHEKVTIKSLPALYDATGLITEQHFATSLDGTRVPYFLVSRKHNLPLDGSTPTILYGYGGFGDSATVVYGPGIGVGWLEKGYAYAVANIRGGGEYGPSWHQAAMKENRKKSFEDFEAVARDLIARGITSPKKLACRGGSHGGLLTSNMYIRSPELFGAVIAEQPVCDMYRYHKMLGGRMWMDEYGDPEKDWDVLRQYSPYHNIDSEAEYPPILFTSSSRDDRVNPAHARKMAGKLIDMGQDKTFLYENPEGGHNWASGKQNVAFLWTLVYGFLEQVLVKGEKLKQATTQ